MYGTDGLELLGDDVYASLQVLGIEEGRNTKNVKEDAQMLCSGDLSLNCYKHSRVAKSDRHSCVMVCLVLQAYSRL